MTKVSVMYLYTPGARFDFDYFCNTHMPLVKAKLALELLARVSQ